MSQLFTVDPNGTSTKLIPVQMADFENDLQSPVIKVYVYVGKEKDPGWSAALQASGWLINLHPYLADDMSLLRKWVPVGDPAGIVFGSDNIPDTLLDRAEASISKIVYNANAGAQ
jgi:hypothetical protein